MENDRKILSPGWLCADVRDTLGIDLRVWRTMAGYWLLGTYQDKIALWLRGVGEDHAASDGLGHTRESILADSEATKQLRKCIS